MVSSQHGWFWAARHLTKKLVAPGWAFQQARSCITFSDLPSEDVSLFLLHWNGYKQVTNLSRFNTRDKDTHLPKGSVKVKKNVGWEKLSWPSLERIICYIYFIGEETEVWKVKLTAQCPPVNMLRSQNMNPGFSDSKPWALTILHPALCSIPSVYSL